MENTTPVTAEKPLVIRQQEVLENTPLVGQTSVAQIVELAKIMAASGMFGDINTAQKAAATMMIGQQVGLTPVQSLTGIHIVKGKPMFHYQVLLAKLRQHPDYDYRIAEHTDKVCSLSILRHGEVIGTETFTIEEARKQGTQNLDKFAKTMLLARATSNALKWHAPDVMNGMPSYSHGELDDSGFDVVEVPASVTDRIRADLASKQAAVDESIEAEGKDIPVEDPQEEGGIKMGAQGVLD